jgi:hypothetical protein
MDFSSIYGPLDKSSCVYFFIWTIFFFIVLVVIFFGEIMFLIKNRKEITRQQVIQGILILCQIFLAYFFNRLLYNMCSKSLA